MNQISVVGLGKLGLPFAICLASKGFKIIGVDIDKKRIEAVNEGVVSTTEPNLQEMLSRYKDLLLATDDLEYAIKNTDITFVVVNTPSNPDGSYSTKQLESVFQGMGKYLRYKDAFHVSVVVSTILPLTCDELLKNILEETSGKECGVDFGLCYSPEFIAQGSIIHDFLNPDFYLIGESDHKSGEIVEKIYKSISNSKIIRTTIANAELAKITLNCFLTTKMSFANTIGEICEKIPNTNVNTITTKILGLDIRISPLYLRSGLGYGGPCFPRDNRAFSFLAKKLGCQSWLAEATDKVNDIQVDRVMEKVNDRLEGYGTVAVLGLSYKPGVELVIESQSLEIAKRLSELGYKVKVYDPMAMKEARYVLGDKVIYSQTIDECLDKVDLCIFATPWKEFENISYKKYIIDPWK